MGMRIVTIRKRWSGHKSSPVDERAMEISFLD
jgi:hypothetical protein